MPVYFDKQKKRWRFTFNRIINGSRRRASRLLPEGWSRAQADAYDRQQGGTLYAQASGIEQPPAHIEQAVHLYIEHRAPKLRNGRKTIMDIGYVMPWFRGRTFDQLGLVAREYQKDNPGLAEATIRNRLAYLRSACRYAWKHHHLGDRHHQPGVDMDLPVPDNQREVYHSPQELIELWKSFDDAEDRALFQLAFFAGLRWQSELHPRQPEDVVRNSNGVWLRVPTTKNKAPRLVPIVPAAVPLLKYLPFKKHPRTHYAGFEAARERAKLEHSVAHDLRHTLASAIISGQGNLSDVGAALGHKSPQASSRYAHLYPSHLRTILRSVAKKMPTKGKKKRGKSARKAA